RDIGIFNRDITLHIDEASDNGLYRPYWENIKKLNKMIEKTPNENEIVKLELYKLTMDALETYSRKFKWDGIKESDLLSVYQSVKKSTKNVEVTTDKTQAMKNEIVKRFGETERAIELAYRKE
ncbi:MAG: serine/threonine protein kinase, partial [Bacillota bacterium]|nr:serine/threonine protein kinase [Bacillota bacterium]